jgi:2-oxoglutarate ferredoxin oxidoreductase subunit gamma
MMHYELILAGFGGQGVLLTGKMLATAAMQAGREVTWMPAYGPEMRGGTCNCTVVVADRPIGSPISKRPHGLIALNLPSLDKFERMVRPGGLIVSNASLIDRLPQRRDVTCVTLPCNTIAIEAGSPKAANMVALGAFLGASGLLPLERLFGVLETVFADREEIVRINTTALNRGYERGQATLCEAC